MKPRPFYREQHEAVGQELHQLRNRLLIIAASVRARYGRSGVSSMAEKARSAVDRLRISLDGVAAFDLPEQYDSHLYYPGSDQTAHKPAGSGENRREDDASIGE